MSNIVIDLHEAGHHEAADMVGHAARDARLGRLAAEIKAQAGKDEDDAGVRKGAAPEVRDQRFYLLGRAAAGRHIAARLEALSLLVRPAQELLAAGTPGRRALLSWLAEERHEVLFTGPELNGKGDAKAERLLALLADPDAEHAKAAKADDRVKAAGDDAEAEDLASLIEPRLLDEASRWHGAAGAFENARRNAITDVMNAAKTMRAGGQAVTPADVAEYARTSLAGIAHCEAASATYRGWAAGCRDAIDLMARLGAAVQAQAEQAGPTPAADWSVRLEKGGGLSSASVESRGEASLPYVLIDIDGDSLRYDFTQATQARAFAERQVDALETLGYRRVEGQPPAGRFRGPDSQSRSGEPQAVVAQIVPERLWLEGRYGAVCLRPGDVAAIDGVDVCGDAYAVAVLNSGAQVALDMTARQLAAAIGWISEGA